jgi:DNA-binding phage protein
MLPPDASEEDKYNYLKNIRISAHNLIAMKSVLGLFAPIAPTTQESIGVPDYLKEVGIVTLRAEFFDLVDAVTKKYGGDVQDPYELALATFMGKYPGKLVYTISRDEKTTKVQIQKTKALKDWAIGNKNLIDKYGQAAFILAPRVGEFDAATYAWLEAADLLQDKSVEKYFVDVMVGQDKQAYYNIARDEKRLLSETISSTARKAIIEQSTAKRKLLKNSNPLLEAALTAGGNEIATEEQMLNSLEEMLANVDISVKPGTRSKLLILTNQMRSFVNMSKDPAVRNVENFTQIKRDRKLAIEQMIAELSDQDLTIKEANRAIFSAILDYYSRDSYIS